jgi:hypothetical protein
VSNPLSRLGHWLTSSGATRPRWIIFCAIAFALAYQFGSNYAQCRALGTNKITCVGFSMITAQGDAYLDFRLLAGRVLSYILP